MLKVPFNYLSVAGDGKKSWIFFSLTPRMSGAQHMNPFNQKIIVDHLKSWQIEFVTSLYFFSPFLSILSGKRGIWLLRNECKNNNKWGSFLPVWFANQFEY